MSKLTARLSDGTEFEVLTQSLTVGGGTHTLLVKPLKPSPPKELWVNVYTTNTRGTTVCAHTDKPVALASLNPPGETHRYVLAEEPKEMDHGLDAAAYLGKKPQPREWWIVYDFVAGKDYVFDNEGAAKISYEHAPTHRRPPIHVREVLNEGSAEKSRVYHLQFRRNGKLLRVLGPIE